MKRPVSFSIPFDSVPRFIRTAARFGLFGKYALSGLARLALFQFCEADETGDNTYVLQIRYDANMGKELEQIAYGKTGGSVEEWAKQVLAKEISRNGLTAQQFQRVKESYGKETLSRLSPLALPLSVSEE